MMKKVLYCVLALSIFLLPSISRSWEVYRIYDEVPASLIPYPADYIHGFADESFFPAGYVGGFRTTYTGAPGGGYSPSGVFETVRYFVFGEPAQVDPPAEVNRSDWLIFQPGAFQTSPNQEVRLP